MSKPFFLSGSRPDQFEQNTDAHNPLSLCPDSPNCVRISIEYHQPEEMVWERVKLVLEKMSPEEISSSTHTKRIVSVFKVFTYRDDFVIQLESQNEYTTLAHIRSYSRAGYTDFGVNRRRVKRFLKLLQKQF